MMNAVWDGYVHSVESLLESERLLAAQLAQVEGAAADDARVVQGKSAELAAEFDELDRQVRAGVAETLSIASAAGVGPSVLAAPALTNPNHVVEQLGQIVMEAQRESALLAGHIRAQQRLDRNAAEADVQRAALDARQSERERKMAEARERAAADRRRQEVPVSLVKTPPPASAPSGPSGFVIVGVIILLAIIVAAVVVLLV